MAVSASFRDYVADQLTPLGPVQIKRMFGAYGLYFEGAMFGVIDDDTVYLRVDDETRPQYLERQMPALRPVRSDPSKVSQNYYQLPGELLDDPEQLQRWAERAIRAAGSKTAAAARRTRASAQRAQTQPDAATKRQRGRRSSKRR